MNHPNLGRQVNFNDIPQEPIKHTGLNQGGSLPYPQSQQPQASSEKVVDPGFYLNKPFNPQHVMGGGSAPPPQGPPPPPDPPVRTKSVVADDFRSIQESEDITRLRERYGVKTPTLHHIQLGDMKFSFRVPGSSDIRWGASLLGELLNIDNAIALQMTMRPAMVAVSVAAINDTPLWQHFGMAVNPATMQDPLYPPKDIRFRAAKYFYDIITDDTLDLGEELETFYVTEIEPLVNKARSPLAPTSHSPGSSTTTTNSGFEPGSQG